MARLVALAVADDPQRWRDVGFTVGPEGALQLGAVRLTVTPPAGGSRAGIAGWSFDGLDGPPADIDGIPTGVAPTSIATGATHPNGATSLDHVVVTTPDLLRTVTALEASGLTALRTRDTDAGGRPVRQVFLRPGEAIIEVVGPPEPAGGGPARFFGVAVTVTDLDAAAALLGHHLGPPKAAVQPGRRIATVRRTAGLAVPVALMSAEGAAPAPAG